MKRQILTLAAALALSLGVQAQIQTDKVVKMHLGDNLEWKSPTLDDASWTDRVPDGHELATPYSYVWFRIHFTLPRSVLSKSNLKQFVRFRIGKLDDADQTFLNGELIGETGEFPYEGGYVSCWDVMRLYDVPVSSKALRWGQDNVLAIRVYNGGGRGGYFDGPVTISAPNLVDFITPEMGEADVKGKHLVTATIRNKAGRACKGRLKIEVNDPEAAKTVAAYDKVVTVGGNKSKTISLPVEANRLLRCKMSYEEESSGTTLSRAYSTRYILTPPTPEAPEFHTPARYGVRPGSPIIYRIPVSGVRPMKFSIAELPEGVKLDAAKGVLSGSLKDRGEYTLDITAENAKGRATKKLTIVVGDTFALTPPMGWSSWNCWGLSVTQDRVKSSAQAIIDKGLADYGYAYINIDDGWESAERNADGTIGTNKKFPDMKALGDWLHGEGLKFGIYSSPGDRTCGGFLGSIDHEQQDAETYNSWGIDYLKYDWCGYQRKFDADSDYTAAAYVRPYLKMQQYLRKQPRDIFYGLCQYGWTEVWKWGPFVDANSWRTTGDITDTWESLLDIGFVRQRELYPYSSPGHWNDPDMLIVGKVGWSNDLRDTRLTPDEQYSHISLWSLLASNMLIGCDVSQMDEFTKRLLCNSEVLAINQDALGKQAKQEVVDGDVQIWKRPLADGSYAVGIFNLGSSDARVNLAKYFAKLGIGQLKSVRDVWRQADISTSDVTYFLPIHGVKYIKIAY